MMDVGNMECRWLLRRDGSLRPGDDVPRYIPRPTQASPARLQPVLTAYQAPSHI